jgi:hypothetical protein
MLKEGQIIAAAAAAAAVWTGCSGGCHQSAEGGVNDCYHSIANADAQW